NSMDEALGLPTENAARIALRTQQVIAHESGVADTVDPFAGSYALEELTTKLEQAAVEYIKKIDDLGGMLRAIEIGFVQNEIQQAAYDYQLAVEREEAIVVGVNRFRTEEHEPIPILKIDEKIEIDQRARLSALRERRDAKTASEALENIASAARTDENLLPKILFAVENYVTVGEISRTLRGVWGEYQENVSV
ncbi:MAG: methylmalonyl-CoA mutase, partial [Acidobacteria bacterium OLB17]